MSVRIIIMVVVIALGLGIYGSISQGLDVLPAGEVNSTMDPNVNTVLSYAIAWQTNPLGTLVNVPAHLDYFTALFKVVTQQQSLNAVYPQASQWVWMWILLGVPIIAGVVFGVIILFIGIIFRNV